MPKPPWERLHFHVAPTPPTSVQATLQRLLALGATRLDIGGGCESATALVDVDGNPFCLVEA